MKKIIAIACMAWIALAGAWADNISAEDITLQKGETKTVNISLTNTESNLVSFQIDLTLPEGISINKAGCSLSNRISDPDQELTIGKQSDNVYRIASTSFALTPISGTSGTLLTLSLTASADSEGGTATLSNIRFVTSQSERVTLDNASFNITFVMPSPAITFADANVKALCVANWDTNGDGELSEAEAAAVTDLGTVFKENTTITSFDELQYFTGLTEIGSHAFADCTSLTSVSLPSTVNKIQEWAFSNSAFTTFAIPDFIEEVAAHSFYSCKQLTSLYVGTGLSTIGWKAFATCPVLSQIVVSENNTNFDSRNESNCIIETGTNTLIVGCKNTSIPSTVTSIATVAFEGCWNLTEITLPNGLVEIGELAFSWCYSMTSITIPASVTSIGSNAFENCGGLNSVTVENESPVAIDENTFSNRANATLYVPYGSKAGYETADYWKDFNIVSWHNIIVNSNMEGDDTTCFFSKEDAGDPLPSIIVDGAGKDGSCGIVLNSADDPVNTWDTQFFVRLPMSLPAGTNYRVKFNYKASRNAEVSTQMHTEPGNYIYREGIGTLNFTTEWQTYEYMGVISSEQSPEDNMQTIAFNLSESNSATTYYFDNFVFEIDEDHITPVATVKMAPIGKILNYTGEAQELINAGTTDDGTMVYQLNWGGFSEAIPTASEVGVYTIDYKVIGSEGYVDSKTYTITAGILSSQMADLIVNGDMEGTDNVCFFSRENRLENDEIVPSTIVEGAGVDGSRGIVVQSIDNPSERWDTQFFIRLPQTLPAGTNYYISFDYKASQEASGSTETHAEPSQYLWYGIGTINYTADWKHFELSGTVSAEQSPVDNPMRTIAFNLAVTPTSTTYYFDNVVFEIDRNQVTPVAIVAEAPTPKELTYTGEAQELINPGEALGGMMQYSLDGTNYSTSIPTGTDAGEYTVYYKVVGDEDHSDSEVATVSVTIAEAMVEETNYLTAADISGIAGGSTSLVISLENEDPIYDIQFKLQLPEGVVVNKNSDNQYKVSYSERLSGLSHEMSYREEGYYTFLIHGMEKPISGNSGPIVTVGLTLSSELAGNYNIEISDIVLTKSDASKVKPRNVDVVLSLTDGQVGDVNRDGDIDVADIRCIANYILGKSNVFFDEDAADANNDGDIDVADIRTIANIILYGSNSSAKEFTDFNNDPQ